MFIAMYYLPEKIFRSRVKNRKLFLCICLELLKDDEKYVGSVTSFGYIMGGSGLVTDKAAVSVFGLYSAEEIVVK